MADLRPVPAQSNLVPWHFRPREGEPNFSLPGIADGRCGSFPGPAGLRVRGRERVSTQYVGQGSAAIDPAQTEPWRGSFAPPAPLLALLRTHTNACLIRQTEASCFVLPCLKLAKAGVLLQPAIHSHGAHIGIKLPMHDVDMFM